MTKSAGILYLVATPIGNLRDMTPRAIETLSGVNTILAEDTRVTRKLCTHFEIATPLERFDENVSQAKIPDLIARLQAGENIALVSDAGTPCISDPGENLSIAARDAGLRVESIPGASATLVALSASGIISSTFYFAGFIPRKASEKRAMFEQAGAIGCTSIFYESPHRLVASLKLLADMYPTRIAAVARELTKVHEEIVRLALPELAQEFAQRDQIKGECVIVLGPASAEEHNTTEQFSDEDIKNLLSAKIAQGLKKSQAVSAVVKETGLARNDVYALALTL